MSRVWRALAALVLPLTVPIDARAYSDPGQFAVPVLEAGGGGRFYTGSPAEGYACDSCHAGGTRPAIEVNGLPERYVPGATYELRVSWPASLEHAAAMLELTDERGRGVGSLALPPAEVYVDAELCAPVEAGVLGGQLYPAEGEREIAATPDCGATLLRAQWTAPASGTGPVWLAGAVLASNHDGNVSGDGVAVFAQPVPEFGTTLHDRVARGSCSIARSPAAASQGFGGGALALAALTHAVRRKRTTRHAGRESSRRLRVG